MKKVLVSIILLSSFFNSFSQSDGRNDKTTRITKPANNSGESFQTNIAKGAMITYVNEIRNIRSGPKTYNEFLESEKLEEKRLSNVEKKALQDIFKFVESNTSDGDILNGYNGKSIIDLWKSPYNPGPISNAIGGKWWHRIREQGRLIGDFVDGTCCNWGWACCP